MITRQASPEALARRRPVSSLLAGVGAVAIEPAAARNFVWSDAERIADAMSASHEAANRVRLMKAVASCAQAAPFHFPYHGRTCADWPKL